LAQAVPLRRLWCAPLPRHAMGQAASATDALCGERDPAAPIIVRHHAPHPSAAASTAAPAATSSTYKRSQPEHRPAEVIPGKGSTQNPTQLQALVRAFVKRAIRGVACEFMHNVTGALRPATYSVDRAFEQFAVASENRSRDEIARLAEIEDVCTTSDDAASDGKGSHVPTIAAMTLSPGKLAQLAVVVCASGNICLVFSSITERDEFQTSLQILRFLPGQILKGSGGVFKSDPKSPPASNFGPSAAGPWQPDPGAQTASISSSHRFADSQGKAVEAL